MPRCMRRWRDCCGRRILNAPKPSQSRLWPPPELLQMSERSVVRPGPVGRSARHCQRDPLLGATGQTPPLRRCLACSGPGLPGPGAIERGDRRGAESCGDLTRASRLSTDAGRLSVCGRRRRGCPAESRMGRKTGRTPLERHVVKTSGPGSPTSPDAVRPCFVEALSFTAREETYSPA